MIKIKPYFASFPTLGGILHAGIGIYFVFLRPPLLPEDSKYIGFSLSAIQNNIPGLSVWLKKVFCVMGAYIFTTGLLTIHIAQTSFPTITPGAFIMVLIAGITSIGTMTIVNFILQSDFKWVLLALTLPWSIALILYLFNK